MTKRTLITLAAALIAACSLHAGVVADGVYRIVCAGNSKVVTEDVLTGKLYCGDKGSDTTYEQLWRLVSKGDDIYTMQNVLTERYIQADGSGQFYTGTNDASIHVAQNAYVKSFLDIWVNNGYKYWNSQGNTANLVTWSACTGDSDGQNNRSAWKTVSVKVDESLVALAHKEFTERIELINNASTYAENAKKYFTDDYADALKSPYCDMSDDELRAAMTDMPSAIVDYAVKLRNDKWDSKWEKEFRLASYKAYGNPDYWSGAMSNSVHGQLNNPTGLRVDNGQMLFIFVGDKIPANSTLQIELLAGTDNVSGTRTTLKRGLNIVSAGRDDQAVFVRYIANTRLDNNLTLADFPPIRINIQGGVVNGFWDKARHTNKDWEEMLHDPSLFSGFAIQVKGDHVLWNMNSKLVRQCVPNHIRESMDVWDSIQVWESRQMGLDQAVPAKHDFFLNCVSVTYNYMFAFGNGTAYNESTLSSILNVSNYRDGSGGSYWGPAHEIGHNNQYLITFPGGTEVSNNMFSNIVVYSGGKSTSRGVGVRDGVCKDFGKSWFDRDIWQQTRMYFQLYLYFYELGKDKEFLPKLHQALRADPMTNHNASSVNGTDSWLKFALKCCEIAQADLSEFFEAYGFFVPVSNRKIEDYATSYVTMTKSAADKAKAQMKQYEKKLGNLVFVEDRIYPAYGRAPWGSPDKLRIDYSNEWPLGKMGDVGQYLDYEDETLVPYGYTYTRKGLKVTISHNDAGGAVGFKAYDEDGNLVAISNTYSLTLPQTMEGHKARIVAAATVGNNDFEIPSSAIAGTEAEQLAALKASLTTAKTYLAMSDENNTTVGWFLTEAIAPLQHICQQAQNAIDASDQSICSYGEWSLAVDDALSELLANADAKVTLHPENYHALYMSDFAKYCATDMSGGLKGAMSDPAADPAKQWLFVPTDKQNEYLIQCVESGKYIASITSGKRVKADGSKENALPFLLKEYTPGKFSFFNQASDLYLSYSGIKEVVGSTVEAASLWILKVVADNYKTQTLANAESMFRKVDMVLGEVATSTSPLALADDIVISADNFMDLVQQLIDVRTQAFALFETQDIAALEQGLTALEAALQTVIDGYKKKVSLPVAGDGTQVPYYYISCLKNGLYMLYDDGTGRYAGCLRMDELNDPDDERFLFYLTLGEDEGTYYICNVATGEAAGISSSYVDISGKRTPSAFTLKLNDDATGIIIANDKGWWGVQSSGSYYIQFRSSYTVDWKFILQGVHDPSAVSTLIAEPSDSPFFDLSGRIVTNPTSGIYLKDGRKILVR